MQRGVAIRLVIFLALSAVAIIYLTPSFVRELPPWWGDYLPADRIHLGLDLQGDRKSTRLNSSHIQKSRMPSSA